MHDLAHADLGVVTEKELRDTFRLDPELPTLGLLTERPKQRNFIRSEDNSLLFRDAAPAFIDAVDEPIYMLRKVESKKGLEFLWSRLDPSVVRYLFSVVASVAGKPEGEELPPTRTSPGESSTQAPPRDLRARNEPATRERHGRTTSLSFDFVPDAIDQTEPLIYAWEIRDRSGKLRYRYVGKAKGGAERPLKHYGRNVANLLAGRPYRRSKPDDFRTVHRRLADAAEWEWSVTLRLVSNVGPSEDIDRVESSYISQLAQDDWPEDREPTSNT